MKKRWSDLSGCQQTAIASMGIVEVGLLAAALWDLAHRKAEEVRGPRAMWAALSLVDFVGPIAYFTIGRKGCCCSWCPCCSDSGEAFIADEVGSENDTGSA
jgi:hypothetical protein